MDRKEVEKLVAEMLDELVIKPECKTFANRESTNLRLENLHRRLGKLEGKDYGYASGDCWLPTEWATKSGK
jgi:hypothetical protein